MTAMGNPGRGSGRGSSDHQGSGINRRVADAADYVVDLRRRRGESERLCILPSGRADPWHYPPPTGRKAAEAARSAWHHLKAHGLLSEHVEAVLAEVA